MARKNTLWNEYLAYLENSEDISSELKIQVKESYEFLRTEFDENFLTNNPRGNPVALKIFNKAPWQVEDLVFFTKTLRKIKESDPHYQILLSKLKGKERSQLEGLPMIEIVQMAFNSNIDIRIEPIVEYSKKPDFELINPQNNDRFYGELSSLDDSDERKRRSSFHFRLFRLIEMTAPYFSYACLLKKPPVDDHIQGVLEFVKYCKSQITTSQSFQFFENDYMKIGFSTQDKLQELKNWATSNNLNLGNISGLELDYDDSKRIINNKIDEKAQQLPNSYNGVIFIRVKPLFFFTDGVSKLIEQTQASLKNYPHVIGLIVYSTLGWEKKESLTPFKNGFLSIKQQNHHTCRYTLFILNNELDLKVSIDTLKKVFRMCES
jgi:hypothetical protein